MDYGFGGVQSAVMGVPRGASSSHSEMAWEQQEEGRTSVQVIHHPGVERREQFSNSGDVIFLQFCFLFEYVDFVENHMGHIGT